MSSGAWCYEPLSIYKWWTLWTRTYDWSGQRKWQQIRLGWGNHQYDGKIQLRTSRWSRTAEKQRWVGSQSLSDGVSVSPILWKIEKIMVVGGLAVPKTLPRCGAESWNEPWAGQALGDGAIVGNQATRSYQLLPKMPKIWQRNAKIAKKMWLTMKNDRKTPPMVYPVWHGVQDGSWLSTRSLVKFKCLFFATPFRTLYFDEVANASFLTEMRTPMCAKVQCSTIASNFPYRL